MTLEAGRTRASRVDNVPVSYAALARDVRAGDRILLDDGKLVLRVRDVRDRAVRCRVMRGGSLTDRKGLNVPGRQLSAAALTRKDRRDLRLAVEMQADWLAVSFVRRARDVRLVRALVRRAGGDSKIMAKIERPEALEELDDILESSDGILVARGDLGVELPPERVPMLQKTIIERANAAGKPVMTATQMLDSMRESRRPTRAEASDVANAVLDGSDALLLTGETAVGRYPREAVAMMDRIIREAEAARPARGEEGAVTHGTAEAICRAAARTAERVAARWIAAFTVSGGTALQVARFRPSVPILAFTPSPRVCGMLSAVWGVQARQTPELDGADDLMRHLETAVRKARLARRGDRVVVLSGYPVGVPGTTNLMAVHSF